LASAQPSRNRAPLAGPQPSGYDARMTAPATPAAVPVLDAVREGFAFVARDWRAILPLAVIGAVGLGALQVFLDMGRARNDLAVTLLLTIAAALVQAVLLAALLRRALSQGEAPAMVALGRDEFNLMGVTLSFGFLYVIIAIFGLIVASMSLAGLLAGAGIDAAALQNLPPEEAARQFMAALGADGTLVLLVVGAAFAALVVWIASRLLLSYPATVAEGRMYAFSTWSWTNGSGLRLAACVLLVTLGGLFLSLVALAPFGVLLDMIFGKGAQKVAGAPAHIVLSTLAAFVSVFFSLGPYAGLTAYLYRGMRANAQPMSAS